MKILVVMGSPRKCETNQFERDYYTLDRVHPLQRVLASGSEKLMWAFLRSVYRRY
jgi:hypothetical protein